MANLGKERQQALLKILHYIQDGGDFTEAKKMFQESFDKVDVSEITAAERELIAQGLDPRKIQYLCNVHADVFKGNIKENVANPDFATPGHPVNTLKQENVVIKSLVNDYLLPNLKKWEKDHSEQTLSKIKQALSDLATIGKHYARKETSFFPLMTKYGITAPPQVMWGVDDKIRRLIKEANNVVNENDVDPAKLRKIIDEVSHEVLEMIFKEEEIMVPMIDEVASPADWGNVKDEEKQIGYTLINPPMNWKPKEEPKTAGPLSVDHLSSLFINFKEGALNLEQLSAILDLLPFALTFVDENDKVAYFGGGAAIFPHSKNAIGNSVFSCHTPESKPIVEKIFQDLHSGEKKVVTYWFKPKMLGRMLYLRYYAVHNKDGKYLGCLEVAEDITDIQKLSGQKKTEE
ncbi:DUF438 domain-containing protein [Lactobacillus acidophilus]|uniref:DUF438 domain-containing protein n=1 Tax=Lactobacillus acidophilus TaxID=1579 RepID=UPI0021A2D239|nr:DUF438 domain-containing protein [Lactobacillus acidophilus]MCT3602215.1 DUF438 domain-containing protein [Lactobacillus acidophilus]MCT3623800.1 DUF438 domain-containing protein [Lactobacillus acidophilus]